MPEHPPSPIEIDPRFLSGIQLFNEQEFFEAGDLFEELFFEAVGGELEFVRTFLQLSVGCLHAERRQHRAATERLHEGILAIDRVTDDRGYDLAALRDEVANLISRVSEPSFTPAGEWPRIRHRP